MLDVFKKLTGSKPPTSKILKEALATIDEPALDAAVALADADRRKALLTGDDRAVDNAEARLATAKRNRDRASAAKEELKERISKLEAAEAGAALDAEQAELEKLASTVAKDLAQGYARASREIVALLERLVEAEERVARFNRKIGDTGRRPLRGVEERAYPPMHPLNLLSAVRLTALRPVPGAPGWGEPRDLWKMVGGEQ